MKHRAGYGHGMSGLTTIVIVDDAAEVRSLIRTRLRLSARFTVVGEGRSGLDAIRLAAKHQPDAMLPARNEDAEKRAVGYKYHAEQQVLTRFEAFNRSQFPGLDTLTEASVQAWIVAARRRGVTPATLQGLVAPVRELGWPATHPGRVCDLLHIIYRSADQTSPGVPW